MLRKRDIVAVLLAVLLSQIAWNRQELLAATVRLSFYIPHPFQQDRILLAPAVFDLDGDEIPDTVVHMLHFPDKNEGGEQKSGSWKLQVVNIQSGNQLPEPFQAPVMMESALIEAKDIEPDLAKHAAAEDQMEIPLMPLSMAVGHVSLKKRGEWEAQRDLSSPFQRRPEKTSSEAKDADSSSSKKHNPTVNNRTRHFFCGEDWHDAAQKCATPCLSGTKADCPTGQKCFADTPCDYFTYEKAKEQQQAQQAGAVLESRLMDTRNVTLTYYLTPVGGLPCVMTLWSNGVVTLHSLTAAKNKNDENGGQLEINLMWQTNVVPNHENIRVLDWVEWTISFVDATVADNGAGMVVVSAMIETVQKDLVNEQDIDDFSTLSTLVATVHARTGKVIWRAFVENSDRDSPPKKPDVLPIQRGTSSAARRRSLNPNLHRSEQNENASLGGSLNCLQSTFRRPLLLSSGVDSDSALPFGYWNEEDSKVKVLHFDLEQPSALQNQAEKGGRTKTKKKQQHHRGPEHGRPNVLVTHDHQGLKVRSLKNGRSLCHLALSEQALYADINHDGVLDSVQLAIGDHAVSGVIPEDGKIDEDADDDLRFVARLAQRVAKSQAKQSGNSSSDEKVMKNKPTALCHLMALSGLPSREEIFSFNMCGSWVETIRQQRNKVISGAPPILIEPRDPSRKGYDILAAVNVGLLYRISGVTGRRQWLTAKSDTERTHNSFPTWYHPEEALIGRIDSPQVIPADRPIILLGEDGLAIFSAGTGKTLASTRFPQPSLRRGVLVDFDGDQVTDVVIQTKDAIWGFKVKVLTGSSVFLRVLVGLLLLGILLALLYNKFGEHPGKRSTDI